MDNANDNVSNTTKTKTKTKGDKFEVLATTLRLGSKKNGDAKKTYKRGDSIELSDAKTIEYLKAKHKIK